MSDDLTPLEEQTLDSFLAETLGGAGPPDLSPEILAQLNQHSERSVSPGSSRPAPVRKSRSLLSRRPLIATATVLAALAASVLGVVWLRSDDRTQDSGAVIADNGSTVAEGPVVAANDPRRRTGTGAALPDAAPTREPRRGIPLVIDSPFNAVDPRMPRGNGETESSAAQKPLDAISLVSRQIDSELRSYWDAIGLQPATTLQASQTVTRLASVLGVELPTDSIENPEQLELAFAQGDVARAIATRWLRQVTQRGLLRLDPTARDGLVEELSACFRSDQDFDRVLAGWLDGQSPNTAAFYAAVSAGDRRGEHGVMARRLAALTMNVDLRCTRCHDSYIEGNGRQQDHWDFAAFLRKGVRRDADGQVSIDESTTSAKPVFYELPDGRQRIAEPLVATGWIRGEVEPIRSVQDWSQTLIGSPELARGVVNSLWQLVHDQPLRGRVVDPISAPHNERLDQLEQHLMEDLIRSRFDVARTLALIISSPATRRGVPTPLLPENAWVADESETRAAMGAVNAFAASLPPRAVRPINARLDEALRAIGATLDSSGQSFNAQLGNPGDKPGNSKFNPKVSPAKELSADFPGRANSLPVQWLKLIEDPRSQVEHLSYLAGMSQAPDSVLETADLMRDAEVPSELLLHRVWWLLRP